MDPVGPFDILEILQRPKIAEAVLAFAKCTGIGYTGTLRNCESLIEEEEIISEEDERDDLSDVADEPF